MILAMSHHLLVTGNAGREQQSFRFCPTNLQLQQKSLACLRRHDRHRCQNRQNARSDKAHAIVAGWGGEGLRLHTRFACFTPSSLSKGGREARREGHFPPQDNKRNSWCLLTPLTRNRDDVSASLPRWPGQAPTWAGETPPAASASMEAARPQTAAPQQRRKKKKKHGRTPQDGKCAQHRALRVLPQVCRTRRNQASTRGLGEDEETLTVLLLSSHPRFCSTTACCPVH